MATRLRASEILHGFDRFLLSIPHWEAASGQVVALLGPSGSGKSTFLNMLGARMVPDEGKVWYAGKPHKRIPLVPGHPRIRMVRQDFGQMPYKSVRDNLLEFSGIRSEAAEHRLVKQWMKRMNLAPALTDKAKALSGGELQRLAIAQAMIGQPGALLLDEPFSHLDPMSKLMIQDMLREWQPRSNSTVVMVVHDVRDAMAWADRIDVMIDGSIVESGSPQAIYENPQSEAMAYAFGRVNAFPVATAPETMRNNPKAFVINGQCYVRPEHVTQGMIPKGSKIIRTEPEGSQSLNVWEDASGHAWYDMA
ncbi:MAG: ABC transporter ATP-binding protein [Flavobacteriales bacterium]|jgi:ABC-type Fe3+/spermidine/putrescine transport system ATPase subunit|nr:ABC transporter ATP-binding protein [Flavobacteriales bacterium]NCF58209.1 ATP-binding cassette domain-containing protein [Bacteroidota bacterium]MBT3572106.1 ABC transporter ATP-binding protein [Flavobacteriales bacterium]MBT3677696.1 ABC transporter ATP-binding protein [Flavobacteriales bacterium]MBT3739999.1 ABC transporter ATP-binding protein [Flavobacteriales bacterium]